MTGKSDYYAILGVTPQATTDMIRAAFATLLADFSEEACDPAANPEYQQILNAFEVLTDSKRRATYDSLVVETAPPALTVTVQASREQIGVSDAAQLLYLLVDVRPPENKSDSRRPMNLCLVIDRSTSMQGARLDCVKSAVDLIIEKLAPDDVISVVSFSDRADVVLPTGRVNNKQALIAKVRGILASGGTEIYQGLSAGMQEMRQVPLTQYTNHLILLTDGHTYGDAEECLQLAGNAAAQGVGFSAFGIGADWNDQFLDKLVAPSGGQSGFAEKPAQVIDHLRKRIRGLGTIYAQNVRLSLDFPRSVRLQYGFKLAPFAQPFPLGTKEIKLGDIEGRSPLSFLCELSIAPQPIETRIHIPVNLIADIPSQQMKERSFKNQLKLFVLSETPPMEPPRDLVKAVRTMNMYRLNEKAFAELEAGELEMATARMRHLSTRLLEAGETKLAQQAHVEMERLATMGTLSLEGRKQLKYGTRSLIGQTAVVSDSK